MSILSVDNISPIGSGTSVTVNSSATLVLNNANSTGVITATSFVGSGANLTNLPAGNLTGALPAISGANLTNLPDTDSITEGNSYAEVLDTGTNGIFRFVSEGNERLRITHDAKVGINTNNPSAPLEIQGDAGVNDAAIYFTRHGSPSNNSVIGQLLFRKGTDSVAMIEALRESANDDAYIRMLTQPTGGNITERLRIDSSGHLLLGTNTAGESNSAADDFVIGNSGSGNSGMSIITGTGNNGHILFGDGDNNTMGGLRYQHSVDVLQLYAGGLTPFQLKSNALGLHEGYPIANSITIRGAATDDTPLLVLKRHTDGAQSDGEIIGKIQFMSNENNVDSGNHQPRAEIHGVTASTSGAAKLDFYTVPNSTTTPIKRMTLNQLGQLTVPNQPSFAVYRNQQAWNIPDGDKMIFNTNRHNVGNCYNTSNGRFTAPVTGSYQLNFYSILQGNYTNAYLQTKVNGNRIFGGDYHWSHDQGSVWHTEAYTQVILLNVNDYVELYSYTGTGSGNVAWHGNNWGCWSGFLLG